MKNIILILTIMIYSYSFSQSNYVKIENIEINKNFRILDTLSFNENQRYVWNKTDKKNKELTIRHIKRQKENAKADTSFYSKIYYLGRKNNEIELKPTEVYYVKKNTSLQFENISLFENDSLYKKFLGYTNRYNGDRTFILYFRKKRRYAILNLDTNYSEIFINVGHIMSKNKYLESIKNRKSTIEKNKQKNNSIPEKIEYINTYEEKIEIEYRVPTLKKTKHNNGYK